MPGRWDWQLDVPGGPFEFGDDSSRWVVQRWDISETPIRTEVFQVPRGDGVIMGTDFKDAPTLTFDMWANGVDENDARDALAALVRAWDSPEVRLTGGRVVELVHPRGRSVFGRPRKIAPTQINRIERGQVEVTATFECVTDLWFGELGAASLSLVPPLGRGLVAPLVEPLTIQGAAVNSRGFTVGGVEPTYPVLTFQGPITNPSLWVDEWELKLRVSLAYDDVLTVDARPWVRQTLLNGRPVAGLLMPSSAWLADLKLSPGFHTAQLRGTDPTGTASVSLTWRDAHPSF